MKPLTALPFRGSTRRTLNRTCKRLSAMELDSNPVVPRTVLLSGLHCPTVTRSPSSTRKAGETCAARLLCRFSYRAYFGTKCRYSRRMTMVLCILVEITVPVKIRPRIETIPVKGHFLSVARVSTRSSISFTHRSCAHHLQELQIADVPIYWPSMAVFGVLKPKPTSLNHLRPPFPTRLLFALLALWLRKMCGCFWKARSD